MQQFPDNLLKGVSEGVERIPIEARKNKVNAINFMIQMKVLNYEINTRDMNVLRNWTDANNKEFEFLIQNEELNYEAETYDFTIDNGNSYVANGIYCHNTINLPSETTVDEIKDIYEESWRTGCKGMTIYRDGSRDGVLIAKEEKKKEDEFRQNDAAKRPKKLECDVHHLQYKGNLYYVVVGLWKNKFPYEIFVGKNQNTETGGIFIPKSMDSGVVKKIRRGNYVLMDNNDNEFQLSGELHDDVVESMTRLVSLSLRHGTNISYVVESLERSTGDMFSFSKVMARTLKKYIENGMKVSGAECPNCGHAMIRENGCQICMDCGYSKC